MLKPCLAACSLLFLIACGKGASVPPPPPPVACTTLADCAGGQVCLNAQCVAICHSSTECKTAGQVCEEGICLAPACGGDSECTGAGQACINGKCATAPAASQVDHCVITP